MNRIVQYHPAVIDADAIGFSIVALNSILQKNNYSSYIACADNNFMLSPYAKLRTSDLEQLNWHPDDLLIVHYSFLNDEHKRIIALPVRKVLVYHNITPSHFFRGRGSMSWIADACDMARTQLSSTAQHFDFSIGDSDYNSSELRELGFDNPETIPVFYDDGFFRSTEIDKPLHHRIKDVPGINILFVGRFVPNKRHDLLIDALGCLRNKIKRPATLHLAGKIWADDYYADLIQRAAALGLVKDIQFYFSASKLAIKTLFASVDAFVSMSEHEGFMVPILEAFATGCPVIAYGGTAVGETMGDAGIKLMRPDPELAAASVDILSQDHVLRSKILRQQAQRATSFDNLKTASTWLSKLHELGLTSEGSRG